MSGNADAPIRCRGCGSIIPAWCIGMAATSRERPYSISDVIDRYTMEADGLWRCGTCQTKHELREAWVLIESLQADRERERAKVRRLREENERLTKAIASGKRLAEVVASLGTCSHMLNAMVEDCDECRESAKSIIAVGEVLTAYREASS